MDEDSLHPDPSPALATGVVGILLAAGRSRRMGQPKQLLRLDPEGDTIVESLAARLRPRLAALVVVVGHVGGQVAAVLADQDVVVAVNPDVDRGMLSSVQCGLRAAGPDVRGYLVCLVDQPGLDVSVVDALVQAAADGAGIALPTWNGRRGHPVYLSRRYADEVLGLDPTRVGLNAVTGAHPDDTVLVSVAGGAILQDMDTPEDLRRERGRRHAEATAAAGANAERETSRG